MSVEYSAIFLRQNEQIGSTNGHTSGIDIQEDLTDVADYFRNAGLGLASLGVQQWDTLKITANDKLYIFNR